MLMNQREKNRVYQQPNWVVPGQVKKKSSGKSRSAVFVVGCLLCGLMVFLLGLDYVLQPQRFPTRHIDVIGDIPNSTSEQIVAAISEVSASNILLVDIAEAAEAAQSLPWVEGATIRRKWPDTIEVEVHERVLLTRWNDGQYLDQLGTVVPMPNLIDTSLPHLSGPDALAQEVLSTYQSWNRVVTNVGLEIQSVQVTERGSWAFSVTPFSLVEDLADEVAQAQTIRVIVGSTNMADRSQRFLKMYTEIFQAVHDQVAVIDLRYPDGVAVTWKGLPPSMQHSATIENS